MSRQSTSLVSPPDATGLAHLDFWRSRLHGSERSFVYVMQGELGTPIKVGIAIDPLERMRGLQTACPWRLHLLYVIPGAREMERALHMRLSGSRMEGEWFGGVAIPEFLQWMHDYCEWGIQNLRRTAELPPVPPHMKPKGKTANRGRRPIKAGGYDAKLGHHWRTDDGKDNPVTVRFVEPMP